MSGEFTDYRALSAYRNHEDWGKDLAGRLMMANSDPSSQTPRQFAGLHQEHKDHLRAATEANVELITYPVSIEEL